MVELPGIVTPQASDSTGSLACPVSARREGRRITPSEKEENLGSGK